MIYSIKALFIYDYFLTLALEVQNMWCRQFRVPTLIFLLNRYLGLALSLVLLCHSGSQAVSQFNDNNAYRY